VDFRKPFNTLRKFSMKLNSKKCVFVVSARKFLGFMINERGIKANLRKVKDMSEIQSPMKIMEVQKLTRCAVIVGKFVLNSTEKCLPLFKYMRSIKHFR